MTTITELPPFNPRLDDYKADEFVQHSLALLEYTIQQDQDRLDREPFQVKPPPLPPEPVIPLLAPVWFPKPSHAVAQAAPLLVQAPRPKAFLGKTAEQYAERVMRPLLAGHGMMHVYGEAGSGKTTILRHIATHDRTKQRFRRVWYMDDPYRVGQLCAILLDDSKVLAEADWNIQLQLLSEALDDNTLIVVDNLTPDHPLLPALRSLSKFVLLGIEIAPVEPQIDENGEPFMEPDPDGIVTLHRWGGEDAIHLLAQTANLVGRKGIPREVRPVLEDMIAIVDGHPLGIVVLGAMLREDGIPPTLLLEQLQQMLTRENYPLGAEIAIAVCLGTLPQSDIDTLWAFGAFGAVGIDMPTLQQVLTVRNPLLLYRMLNQFQRRNLIQPDERYGAHYTASSFIYQQALAKDPHELGNQLGIRARTWLADSISQAAYDALTLFNLEPHLRFAYQLVADRQLYDFAGKFSSTVSDYLRTYIPALLPHDAPPPRFMGERAQAIQQARQGLDTAAEGDPETGRETIQDALKTLKTYGSDHDYAQALTMQARLEDQTGNYPQAIKLLEDAAKRLFDLNAESSLSITRLGLAIAYRHQGRYKDALGVLDERPEADAERARIYRAMGDLKSMTAVLGKSSDMTAYAKAESYLQARHYADALQAIAHDNTPQTEYLRALIYHLQEDYDHALVGYARAVERYADDDPLQAIPIRAMAAIHTLQGDLSTAEQKLLALLEKLQSLKAPEQYGMTQGLLAAVHLQQGNNRTAMETASQGLQRLIKTDFHKDIADAYRVLGRAAWRLERYEDALKAFTQEVEHVQSEPERDETRIGIAFFHLGEAHRKNDNLERSVANLRRALGHIDNNQEPLAYFMALSALYRVLKEAERTEDAFEINEQSIRHLDSAPPPNLQHLGFMLMHHVRALQQQTQHDQAYKSFLRWLNTLVGRADALDPETPHLRILVMGLAVRSLMAYNRVAEALPIAAEVLPLAMETLTGYPQIQWAVRRDYGEILVQQEDWETALQVLTPLLHKDVAVLPHTYAAANEAAAMAQHHSGEHRKALELFWVALDAQPVPHKQGLIFEKAANTYLALGESSHAVENFNEAIKMIDRQVFPGIAARVLTSLAHTLAGMNRYADAIGVYEDALDMLRNVPDAAPLYTARVYASLGRSNERQGQLHEASTAYRQALDIIEQRGVQSPEDYRGIMLRLARVLVIRSSYDDAIHYFERARDDAHNWGTSLEVGNITRELAEAQRDGGYLEISLQTYTDGLDLVTKEHPTDRAAILRSHGQALSQNEQFDEARRAWQEALELTADLSPLEIALTHHAIGQAFRAQKAYDNAEAAFRKALDNHPKGTIEQANTYRELGESLLEAAKLDDAQPTLQTALDVEKAMPQQSNARLVKTLQLLGVTEERRGKRQQAITHYHAALIYMDKSFQPQLYAYTLRKLGQLYAAGNQWDECQKAFSESLDIELNMQNRSNDRIGQTLRLIAEAYRDEGHLENTANAYKRLASYTNLSNDDQQELRTALDDIDRYKGTLNTALESLHVMQKTDAQEKDFVFVYALIVRMYYLLNDYEQSRHMMGQLVKYLHDNAAAFSIEDDRTDYRVLAYFRLALMSEQQGDPARARDNYRAALKDNSDSAMQWLIEQSMAAVM